MSSRWMVSACAALALVARTGVAADKPEVAELGKPVKDFSLKCCETGKEFKLSDAKGKVVVVDFTNFNCPMVTKYNSRIAAFTAEVKDKSVVVVHVDSVNGNTVDAIKAACEKQNWGAPVLRDEGNVVADYFQARVTPHIYVIDQKGNLAYRGSFDDNPDTAKVSKHYVADAVKALLAGSEVETKETKAFGCGISRVKK